MAKKYKIIVTGATGFVGRRLIKLLIKKYNKKEILCLIWDKNNDLERSGREILKDLKVKTKKIDLVTGMGLKNLPKKPQLVIHLAANTDTNIKDHSVNNIGTRNLLNALTLTPKSHFIHIGTMVAMSGRQNTTQPFTEYDPLKPNNEYTRTKAEGEKIVLEKLKDQKFKLSILRPNTIYGSSMRPDSLFDFIKKLIYKKSIFARLNWPGLSSLIYVEDVAKAIILVSKKPPKSGEHRIYLLHGENLSLSEMLSLTHKSLKLSYKKIKLPSVFWKACSLGRDIIPLFEKVTNAKTYNLIWRASIIVDNVIYCKPVNMPYYFPKWKPAKLKDHINEVIYSKA